MKIKLLFFATLLALTSCSNNEDEVTADVSQPVSLKPNKISWIFPLLAQSSPPESDPNYYFEYDAQGRVTKKVGGAVGISGGTGTGVSTIFSSLIYTSVSYNGNSITMGNYSSDSLFYPYLDKKTFELDVQGKIINSVFYSQYPEWEKHLTYNYDSAGKLTEILTQLPNMPYISTDPNDYVLTYVEKFTYDTLGNLQKAVTTERHNNADAFVIKETEFGNYDMAQNPFKSLAIFDDYFYLSLSKNNPQKKITRVYQQGNGFTLNQKDWTNQYDSNGNLKLYY